MPSRWSPVWGGLRLAAEDGRRGGAEAYEAVLAGAAVLGPSPAANLLNPSSAEQLHPHVVTKNHTNFSDYHGPIINTLFNHKHPRKQSNYPNLKPEIIENPARDSNYKRITLSPKP